jgi:putative flippase GtrA
MMKGKRNISNGRKEITYLARYAWSGVINTILGFIVIFSSMSLGFSPFVSNVAGYSVGFILGFVMSKNFVFRSNGHLVMESVRYLTAFVVSFLVNLIVLRVSLVDFKLNVILSQILAALSYTLLMYLFMRIFVFRATDNINILSSK